METWENIWGIWNQMTPRDSEIVRRIGRIERRFAGNLVSADWEPHTPTLQTGIYASKWPGSDRTLWTIVNRNEFDVDGPQIAIRQHAGQRYFDLWHGTELTPLTRGNSLEFSFPMEANGYGAMLAIDAAAVDTDLNTFLAGMHELSKAKAGWLFNGAERSEAEDNLDPLCQAAGRPPDGNAAHPGRQFSVRGIRYRD
jgi:gamma-glutamyl hercynylcysteine S-oxide synthase